MSTSDLFADLTEAQREAVAFPSAAHPKHKKKKHLLIEAGAGAGKTHVLSRRAARLCTPRVPGGVHPSRLFLVTFSRAADRELRERVQRTLSGRGLETEARLVHISTIDSLLLSLVETRFPIFWEDAIRSLWANTVNIHRYSPPSITILDEALVKEKLARRLESVLESFASSEALARVVCDFLLSGALSVGQGGLGASAGSNEGVLGGILSALLSEHMLCLDVPPPLLAAKSYHPALPEVLASLRALARECYAERLLKGTLTYTDVSVFLYNLYCAPTECRTGTLFDCAVPAEFPVAPEELIVDEYQDTSRIQHALLYKLATHRGGRMVVVGDPKQSIYGFRNAHVEVMESLKHNEEWHHVELTRNFRSDPQLLEEINTLSAIAFNWAEDVFPAPFLGSGFQAAANARRVHHNPLTAGREGGRADLNASSASDSEQTSTKTPIRVEILSASLGKERGAPDSLPPGALREYLWDVFCKNVLSLSQTRSTRDAESNIIRFPWSDVAVLCERNEHVRETARRLVEAGVPATALVSGVGRSGDARRVSHLRATLFLLQSLLRPLKSVELFEVFCSCYVSLPWDECVAFFSAYGSRAASAFFEATPDSFPEGPGDEGGALRWPSLKAFHSRWHAARSCSPAFAFQAWQTLRMPGSEQGGKNSYEESLECALGDEFAILFSAWCGARSGLEGYEDLPTKLEHWRVRMDFDAQLASDPNAVQVMTIHAAKGLEWPYVYFWPQARRDRKARDFELVSHDTRPMLKWLPADRTTLGVLNWKENDEAVGPTSAPFLKEGAKKPQEVHFTDLQKSLEETYERQRVFYTAFTRAREFLALVHPLPASNRRNSLRDKLGTLALHEKGDYRECKIKTLEEGVFARYLDLYFNTGHASVKNGAGRAKKEWEEPWASNAHSRNVECKPWIRFTEPSALHWSPRPSEAIEDEEENHIPPAPMPDLNKGNASIVHAASFEIPFPGRWKWPSLSLSPVPSAAATGTFSSTAAARTSASVAPLKSPREGLGLRSRAELNPYYARRLAASQGVFYHARQELALDAENPARTLRRLAFRTWQELEIWHDEKVENETENETENSQSEMFNTDGLLLNAPARNILDFLCYIEAKDFPRAFLSPDALSSVLALPPHTLLACVLDFKTGTPSPEHDLQMSHYASLAKRLVKDGFGLLRPPETFSQIVLLCHELERAQENAFTNSPESADASTTARLAAWNAHNGADGVFLGSAFFLRSRVLTET